MEIESRVIPRGLLVALVIAGLAPWSAQADDTRPDVRIAVFDDEGVGRSVDDLLETLGREAAFKVQRITAEQIRTQGLADVDVLIHPGGSGSKQGRCLAEAGREQIRDYVRDGGGFIGICAGAYLATADYDWSLHLLDAKVLDRKHWARGTGDVTVRLSDAGQAFFDHETEDVTIYYGQGPLLAPAGRDDIPDYQPLGVYQSEIAKKGAPRGVMIGTSAIASAEFGEGRVLCFSPHPEKNGRLKQFVIQAVRWTAQTDDNGDQP